MGTKYTVVEKKLDKEISLVLAEGEAPYKLKSGKTTYSDFLSNPMQIIQTIRAGIPYTLFSTISDYTPFTEKDWAEFLDISTKSLQRYKQSNHQFKPIHTEKIIEMSEVTHAGLEFFRSNEKFRLWLDTPNFALGNLPPIELLKDSYGKEMVMAEITRLSHGIFA